MSEDRYIPAEIKRGVRQRCGFGCVICGLPIYEYEHMEGWAEVQRHIAEEITLLCPNHHSEKTKGLLPVEKVKEANENPYNIRVGESEKLDLHYSGESLIVTIGTLTFTKHESYNSMIPIIIDGVPIIEVVTENNHVFLNLKIYDDENNLVLQVEENQLIHKVGIWDIEFVSNVLTLRQASRDILLVIKFAAPDKLIIKKGRIVYKDHEIIIDEPEVKIDGSLMVQGNLTVVGRVGIKIGSGTEGVPAVISM